MKKQIISLISVGALIATVLSGCGDQTTAEVSSYDYEPVSSYEEVSSTEQDTSSTVTEVVSSEVTSSKAESKAPSKTPSKTSSKTPSKTPSKTESKAPNETESKVSNNSTTNTPSKEEISNDIHSSIENAVKAYCKAHNERNFEKCREILPPDYMVALMAEEYTSIDKFLAGLMSEFPNIKLERITRKIEVPIDNQAKLLFPNTDKIVVCCADVFCNNEEWKDVPMFFSTLQNGKWYAIAGEGLEDLI